MPKKLISETKKKRIISKYKKGLGMRVIAEQIGCAPETVRRILRNAPDVTIRKRGTQAGSKKSKNNKKVVIFNHPGSEGPIGNSPKKEKRFKRKKTGPGLENACKTWNKHEDEILIDAISSGMELEDAASLLGRTKIAVSGRKHLLIKKGIITESGKRFPRPEGITYNRHDEAEVMETMNSMNMEQENQSSPMTNVSLSDIAQVVRDYGVSAKISITVEGTKIDITA
jgi:hypothetical protein